MQKELLLKDYLLSLSEVDINIINDNLARVDTVEEYLDKLLHYLDCSRYTKDGFRLIQTISYSYKREISKYLYVLETYLDNSSEYIDKLITLHKNNLEYEAENGTVKYEKKKKKAKPKETTKEPKEVKEKKPSIAAIKAANKAIKIGLLKFKVKK